MNSDSKSLGRLFSASVALAASGFSLSAHAQQLTTLYSFTGKFDGATPIAPLVFAKGSLYGTTVAGGSDNWGTVFALNPVTRVETVVHSFPYVDSDSRDGASPTAGLTLHQGVLYGTTENGGTPSVGAGSIFSVNLSTGSEALLYSFDQTGGAASTGGGPTAGLTYLDGYFYGAAEWGGRYINGGTVFKVDPVTGATTTIYDFTGGVDGASPAASLLHFGGELYGTTQIGGAYSQGVVFKVNPATGAEKVVHSFTGGADGSWPDASLINYKGILYGTAAFGGIGQMGTVFSINPKSGTLSVLHDFTGGADGQNPQASLLYFNGSLYGTTQNGGKDNAGTVFAIDLATGNESIVYSFTSGTDGKYPLAALIALNGKLYGTTSEGGQYGHGTVFALTP